MQDGWFPAVPFCSRRRAQRLGTPPAVPYKRRSFGAEANASENRERGEFRGVPSAVRGPAGSMPLALKAGKVSGLGVSPSQKTGRRR